jgi:hypothetical protein
MNDDDRNSPIAKYIKTSGHKKLMNYVQALFEDPKFIEDVMKLRKKVGIVTGKEIIPLTGAGIKRISIYQKGLDALLLKYKLNYMWADMISMFVNDFTKNGASWGTICELQDVEEMKEDPLMDHNIKLDDNAFPLALRISPYATQRDLIDYIKVLYKDTIKPMQDKYLDKEVKIGKFRSKKEHIKKRNAFIIENQHLPAKKIASLVAKEFDEFLDYGHISKIIYLSKRK